MSVFSTAFKDFLMNNLFRGVPFSPPSTIYVALHTSANLNSEISGNGYMRAAAHFSLSSNGVINNDVAVTFPVAAGLWPTTGFFSFFSEPRGGTPVVIPQPLEAPEQGIAGRSIVFPINGLTIRLDP